MHTYLGEQSSEYNSLISKSIVDNEINQYNIKNSRGEFTGYNVVKDDVEGYAYYHSKGDIYEFSPSKDCEVTLLKTLKISEQKTLSTLQANDAIFKKRNERTKEVQRYNVSFVDLSLQEKKVNAVKAISEEVNGFIFHKKIKHQTLPNLDKTSLIFIPSNNVTVLDRTSTYELLTQEESLLKNKQIQEEKYNSNVQYLAEKNINVKKLDDLSTLAKTNFSYLVTNLEAFFKEAGTNPFDKTYNDINHLSNEVGKERNAFRLKALQNKLADTYGFYAEATENYDADQLSLDLKNKDGKTISSLITNEAFYTHEQVVGKDKHDEEVLEEVEFTTFNLDNETESEEKTVQVFEGGKMIELADSKYKDFYELFDNLAFTVSELAVEFETKNIINEYEEEYEAEHTNLSNPTDLNLFAEFVLKDNPTVGNKFKSKTKKLNP